MLIKRKDNNKKYNYTQTSSGLHIIFSKYFKYSMAMWSWYDNVAMWS